LSNLFERMRDMGLLPSCCRFVEVTALFFIFGLTAVRLSEEERRENPLVSVASDEKWTVST
jgi:hypothetical protein